VAKVSHVVSFVLLITIAVAALISPSKAAVVTYDVAPNSIVLFNDGSSETVTGTFSFNTSTVALTSVDLTLSGTGPETGVFTLTSQEGRPNEILAENNSQSLFIEFTAAIPASPLTTEEIQVESFANTTFTSASAITFTAAVPEPSTWLMMILGFAGVGFMAYRRKSNHNTMALKRRVV
jgi:hypothetical protein